MMRTSIATALSLLFVPISSGAPPKDGESLTAYIGATLIDGTGRASRPDAVLLVAAERIAAVGSRNEVKIPEKGRVVDAKGKWIIPGLVDAHVHFFQSGGLYTRPDVVDLRAIRPYAEEMAHIKQRLPKTLARYLASGVTSVLDLGGPLWNFELRALAERLPLAPRVAVAGPLLSTYVPAELRSDDPANVKVTSPEEARHEVRRQLAHRPDLIKIWFIPLTGKRLAEQTAWVRTAIEESHAAGVRVAVHATQLEIARAALGAGADILAHSVEDRPVDEAFIGLSRERKVVYIPTLIVHEGYRDVLGQRVELTDIERRLGDPESIATWGDLARLPFWKRPSRSFRWPSREPMFGNLKRLREGGIIIAAGTDAGNIGTLHGPALHRELERMAETGLSTREILTAATQGGARAMGRASELGTIEAGKLADFLLVDADPLAEIANTRLIYRVVKGGVMLNPRAMLEAQ
jgi:imidazolonepropionase-like amidohydrolase